MDGSKKSLVNQNFDKLVDECLHAFRIPGLALAVIDGQNSWEKGYGFADAESKEKVKPTTLFSTGSTSKSFTAAAASLLVDDNTKHGDITWETPMHRLIPEDFVLESTYATTHITLADCLSHRSGMPSHHADLGGRSVKENTRNLCHLPMTKEPRTTWQYSNHMYWAVSHMIEIHSGLTLENFLKDRIWEPLGMKSTFLSIKTAQQFVKESENVNFAKPHMWDEEREAFKVLPYWDDEGISGAGGIVSNVVDYATWIRSFIEQSGPLSSEGYNAVTSPQMVMPLLSQRFTGPLCYGFGWWISVYHGERILLHPGGLIGSVASMIYLPGRKWGVVGMCNGTSEAALDTLMWYLIDQFLGIAEKEPDVVSEATMAREGMKGYFAGAKDRLFPSIPNPAISPSLPLAAYTGSYTHPSYGTISLHSSDNELCGRFPGKVSLDPLKLEHVNGEFFLAKAEIISLISVRARCRFEIDVGGRPHRLGVEFDEGDPDLIIWFVRAAAE